MQIEAVRKQSELWGVRTINANSASDGVLATVAAVGSINSDGHFIPDNCEDPAAEVDDEAGYAGCAFGDEVHEEEWEEWVDWDSCCN